MPSTTFNSVVAQSSPVMIAQVINAIRDSPSFFAQIQAFSFPGYATPITRRTARPEGHFHLPGEGVPIGSSTFVKADLNAHPITLALRVPTQVAKSSTRGAQAVLDAELEGGFEGVFETLEKSLFYGNSATYEGFDGIATLLNTLANPQVVGAGGTTANAQTSLYAMALSTEDDALRKKDGAQGLMWGIGGDGAIDARPWSVQQCDQFDEDGIFVETIPCLTTEVEGQIGLHIGASFGIARLANVDATHPPTTNLIDDLISRIRVKKGVKIVVVGSRKGINLYKASRRAQEGGWTQPYNAEGKFFYEDSLTEFFISDYVRDNEAVVA